MMIDIIIERKATGMTDKYKRPVWVSWVLVLLAVALTVAVAWAWVHDVSIVGPVIGVSAVFFAVVGLFCYMWRSMVIVLLILLVGALASAAGWEWMSNVSVLIAACLLGILSSAGLPKGKLRQSDDENDSGMESSKGAGKKLGKPWESEEG